MEDERILTILNEWNFWGNKPLELGIKRRVYVDKIKDILKDTEVVAEVGVRRCGKSFVARQVLNEFILEGYDVNSTLIINLSDERWPADSAGLLNEIFDVYKRELKPKQKPLIVIDEAQQLQGWEKFVRGMSERLAAKFIITGSSSALLSSEFATLLSGRHVVINIVPVDFKEFLLFKGINVDGMLSAAQNIEKISTEILEYAKNGGFPAVIIAKNKDELLLSYLDTIIIKDVSMRYKIRAADKLKVLIKFYIANAASSMTFNSISKFLELPLKTVQRFSEYLSNAYIIFFVNRFSSSIKEQENSPRKVYAIDNGFVSSFSESQSDIKGKLIENMVAIELLRHSYCSRKIKIYYWKSKNNSKEVDFLVKSGTNLEILQVAYSLDRLETQKREIDSLLACAKELGLKEGKIITLKNDRSEIIEGIKIHYVPLWKWLLNIN